MDPFLTLRGKPLLLLTVVLLKALRFLPTIPLPGRGIPRGNVKIPARVGVSDDLDKNEDLMTPNRVIMK